MHKWYLALFLMFLLPVMAQTDDSWAFQSKKLTIDARLAGEITLEPTATSFSETNYVQADLAFAPMENDRQKIISFQSVPDASISEGTLTYRWVDPAKGAVLPFYWKATLETQYGLVRVDEKIGFPINPKDMKGFEEYVAFTENIDVDDDIRALANDIARGEDDLYGLVYKVSEWLKQNVEYNLDYSLTLEKPTDVLKTKQGVCDEFTALFVSILRSLNVPTKYVSGYAYTNLKKPSGFGPHAWAEVYFPGVGWIPFDVTYNQFGYIDATHIKLKDSFDSGSYSARYEWRGRNVELISQPLDFSAEVTKVGEKIDQRVSLKASFARASAGFGSYNLVQAEISNLNNFYTGLTVYASLSDQLEFFDENAKDVLLGPFETKKVSWLVRLNNDLDKNFQYTVPVKVYLADGVSSEASFISRSKEKVYSKIEMERLQEFTADEQEIVENELDIVCLLPPSPLFKDQEFEVGCTLRNAGTIELFDISVCIGTDCKALDLGIAQSAQVTFTYKESKAGEADIFIVAQNADIKKTVALLANIQEYPSVDIQQVYAPLEITYDERFRIEFLLHRSTATPKNVHISILNGQHEVRSWDLAELESDRKFILDYGGHLLKSGQNLFTVQVAYEDTLGKTYSSTHGMSISLVNVTFAQRMYILAHSLGAGKSDFDMIVYVIFSFALGGLIGFGIMHSRDVVRWIRLRKTHSNPRQEAHEQDVGAQEDLSIASPDEEPTSAPIEQASSVKSELKPPEKIVAEKPKEPQKHEHKKEHKESKEEIIHKLGKEVNQNIEKKFKELK